MPSAGRAVAPRRLERLLGVPRGEWAQMSTNQVSGGDDRKLGALPFVIGGLSFIPLIGVLFGIITIVWGLIKRKSGGIKLALIGAGGICFTIIIYGGLFYLGFSQRGGIYDDLRAKLAQSDLDSLVKVVEVYRLAHGEYPESLQVLEGSLPKGSIELAMLIDPRIMEAKGSHDYFYYERVGKEHYYLRGVGVDGKPFSPGALVPQTANSGAGLGLLTDPR
jgi:hypothetical protein